MATEDLTIISSCPALRPGQSGESYIESVRNAVCLAEEHGWAAMLIYTDNKQVDPWAVAQLVLTNSKKLSPLVAVQPLYLHPVAVAKSVASLSTLYGRPVHLNYVSGGLPRDLESLCDCITHDERYLRLREYGTIIRQLLSNDRKPYSYAGRYYQIRHLEMHPHIPPTCQPMSTMSGSSPAGLACAEQIGARAIQYMKPRDGYDAGWKVHPDLKYGIRVGIIARASYELAWAVARQRFPESPEGQKIRAYFSQVSDSTWVKELNAVTELSNGHPYWLGPFKNGQASSPFLVGDIEAVANELAGYMKLGLRTFLLEKPQNVEDADNINIAFQMATAINS